MKRLLVGAAGVGIAVVIALPLLGAPARAADPEPTQTGSVTVSIPGATSTPSPSSTSGSGGQQGSPGGNDSGGEDDGGGVTPPSCTTTDPDGVAGAPIIPAKPDSSAADLTIDPDVASAGSMVTVSADGFGAEERVQIVLYPSQEVVGDSTADAAGALRARVELPESTTLGAHHIEATGWVSCAVAGGDLDITSPSGSGFSPYPWVTWVVAGGGVLLALLLLALANVLGWLPRFTPGPSAGTS